MAVWLAHAGRKSECEGLIAPSALKFSESYKTPRQMGAEDIVSVKQAFVRAAVRVQRRIRRDRGRGATVRRHLRRGGLWQRAASKSKFRASRDE
ncbi:MAG: hypothetical protein ACFNTA_06400 [Campylobacter sp.]|uniref:hypothetical protein n=1 Tax=Campylobacter sp. TaxID=205 RepID=UPI00361D6789